MKARRAATSLPSWPRRSARRASVKEARVRATAELKKLRAMAPMSAEATVARNYLDVLLGLPWGKKSKLKKDIAEAQRVLDEDHYGLEKVKERIVEYLAVQARTNKLKGPILCLVGPPGVGKTSLGRSIARATGPRVRPPVARRRSRRGGDPRPPADLHRLASGQDHFEHQEGRRRPTRCSCSMRSTSSARISAATRRSALLEVLDPEQNSRFQDHYLELDYDLSDVMFVTTANSLDMPQPLLDRMEIIRLEGYTEDEKVEIAKRHLIPKQMEAHGLKPEELVFTDDALRKMIQHYTREAGVRTLERELAKVARKSLRQILEGKVEKVELTPGEPRRLPRRAQIPLRNGRGRGPDRRRHRPRLDRGRRRAADDRSGHRSRQGPDQDHRQARRSDAGVDPGGDELRQGAGAGLWRQAVDLRPQGHPRPPARRRGAEGRSVGGHRHGHGDDLDLERASRSAATSR